VLRAKLRRLHEWNAQRRAAAGVYDALLGGTPGLRLPVTLPGNEHVWHLYVVRVGNRDEVLRRARAEGIGASVHYPTPVHLTPAMAQYGGGAGSMPVSERAAGEILSLPIYPGITVEQQERVAEVVRDAVGASRA
jgi:dTDP-4-amino-4,6-dideoxygalactose transaminase